MLVILSVSLYPYLGWRWPITRFCLSRLQQPYYGSPVDDVLNILAYFRWAWPAAQPATTPGTSPWAAGAVAAVAGLSFCIETLQVFLPNRRCPNIDIGNNALGGALGAGLAAMLAAKPIMHRLAMLRQSWFQEGSHIDYGLVVVGLVLYPAGPIHSAVWRDCSATWLPQTRLRPHRRCIAVSAHTGRPQFRSEPDQPVAVAVTLLLSIDAYGRQSDADWTDLLLKMALAGMLLKPARPVPVAELADCRPNGDCWPAVAADPAAPPLACTGNRIGDHNLVVGWLCRCAKPLSSLSAFRWSGHNLNLQRNGHTIADIWPFLSLIFLLRYFQLERQRQDKHAGSRKPQDGRRPVFEPASITIGNRPKAQ